MPYVPTYSPLDMLRGMARELQMQNAVPVRNNASEVNRSPVKIYPDMETEAMLRQLSGPHWRRVLNPK